MQTIKGPGLFIAQFVDADAQLGTLEGIAAFAAECGFTALQMPTFYPKIFDLEQAAREPVLLRRYSWRRCQTTDCAFRS